MPLTIAVTNTHIHRAGKDPTDAARNLLIQLLERASYDGEWQAFVGDQKSLSGNARFRVVRQEGRSVRVRLRPGDGASCWDWDIFPPACYDAAAVGKDLERFNGWNGDPDKVATVTPKSVPAEKRLSLAARLVELEAQAAGYIARKDAIEKARAEVVRMMEEADQLEKNMQSWEAELLADHEGAAAAAALESLSKLFG